MHLKIHYKIFYAKVQGLISLMFFYLHFGSDSKFVSIQIATKQLIQNFAHRLPVVIMTGATFCNDRTTMNLNTKYYSHMKSPQ